MSSGSDEDDETPNTIAGTTVGMSDAVAVAVLGAFEGPRTTVFVGPL
ncbi:hypothetical protein [Natronolimnobius baerhuensis]|nr:hypothetical protein [Natronolimnobius baerhuensis]